MYARGILFGKMRYELGDHAVVRCPETGLEADVEFKVKGWIGGAYNAIGGFIKDSKTGKQLFELSGMWNEQMYIKDLSTGKKELFFDAANSKPSFPKARPISEQHPRESQRLWESTTKAIKKADQKTATDEKSRIEDEQRREAAERGEEEWRPKLFKPAPKGDEENLDWIIDAEVDDQGPAEKQVEQILAIAPILPGQKAGGKLSQDEKSPSRGNPDQPDPVGYRTVYTVIMRRVRGVDLDIKGKAAARSVWPLASKLRGSWAGFMDMTRAQTLTSSLRTSRQDAHMKAWEKDAD